jgi:hypothetical protein
VITLEGVSLAARAHARIPFANASVLDRVLRCRERHPGVAAALAALTAHPAGHGQ